MEKGEKEKEQDKMQEKETKNERIFITILLILAALIIIIFLLIKNLGLIEHRPLIPTGNVEIFDVVLGKECKECNCETPDRNPGGNTGEEENKGENENPKGEVQVFDENTTYSNHTALSIFTKTAYHVVEGKIAPGSENSYQFVIRNNNDINIQYNLTMTENNPYNINMKYRLKMNGVYLVGNEDTWVSYQELRQYNIALGSKNYDVYTLDWKWFESSNDTKVGTNINSNYQLEIKIAASAY